MRTALVALVALAAGLLLFGLFMGDLGQGETAVSRVALGAGLFLAAGLAVGLLTPRRWPMAALSAWAPLVRGAVGLVQGLAQGTEPVYLDVLLLGFGAMLVALGGGWAGSRVWRQTE